jgi:hypothetical protein
LQQGRVTGFNPDRAQRTEQADEKTKARRRQLPGSRRRRRQSSDLILGSWFLVLVSWPLALGGTWWVVWSHLGTHGTLKTLSCTTEYLASLLILYIGICTQLGILHLSALAGLSDLRSGSACRAAAAPVCSYIHELYATHQSYAGGRLHTTTTYQGSMGTWMDACTVQYVACGGAVIKYWLAETRAGLSLTLGPKGLRCRSKALFAGRIE